MASSKRSKLLERVSQTRRQPRPQRILDADQSSRKQKGYKIVAISLYLPELGWTDGLAKQLQRAGVAKASRSLVIREAIYELQSLLEGKSSDELLNFFLSRQASRTAVNNAS
jgi:hypothetical protein